jgi:hypothetical protein
VTQAGEKIVREIPVTLTANPAKQNVLPSFWARRKIDDLMSQDWSGVQGGNMKPELQKEITQLGLDYRLMTSSPHGWRWKSVSSRKTVNRNESKFRSRCQMASAMNTYLAVWNDC